MDSSTVLSEEVLSLVQWSADTTYAVQLTQRFADKTKFCE